MIRIERLHYSVGNFSLQDISFHVQPGEYFVLLGPSGSGKTVLLECLCGLNRPDSGQITIGGADVTHLEPRNRGVGYLPQDYALFPDRSVARNTVYGLESDADFYRRELLGTLAFLPRLGLAACRRLAGRRLEEAVPPESARFLDMMGVRHLAGRRPGRLSGGEKQRVALARALAVRPQVLLLDEPVSALDEQTRDALCPELKRLQQNTKTTTIHVCHSLAEMLAVADRVGIIRNGGILQVGTPQEILERPRTRVVAEFVQVGNLFTARGEPGGEWTELRGPDGVRFLAPRSAIVPNGEDVSFMIRPEYIQVEKQPPSDMPPGTTRLEGTVRMLTDSGPLVRLTVQCDRDLSLQVSMGKSQYNQRRFLPGDRVHLAVAPEDVHVLDG
ncbi:MAG: ABC transporter ATP-binding protein [Planctomycetaceae bacterium]|nr:ABC transporter ATP-binding protein [Planctomycetaceae bacterium]